jgi:hypothetical protein
MSYENKMFQKRVLGLIMCLILLIVAFDHQPNYTEQDMGPINYNNIHNWSNGPTPDFY